MLLRAQFQNYRCFRQAVLEFSPLTVLVGANASGKSSVLTALRLWSGGGGLAPTDVRQHDSDTSLEIKFDSDDGKTQAFGMSRHGLSRTPPHPVGSQAVQVLNLSLPSLRSPNVVAEGKTLDANGHNLTNVFATLDRRRQQKAVELFRKFVPVFSDIHAKPIYDGNHQLRFSDAFRDEVWYTPEEVSDGTMLVLAFLLTQYQIPQVDLLAIEEPERGLHPYLLGNLMRFLRAMAHGEVGSKAVQIVLATHSATLLDHAQPDEVRFFKRAADGSVTIESAPHGDASWSEYYSTYQESLGQAWLSGGLGGVPGA